MKGFFQATIGWLLAVIAAQQILLYGLTYHLYSWNSINKLLSARVILLNQITLFYDWFVRSKDPLPVSSIEVHICNYINSDKINSRTVTSTIPRGEPVTMTETSSWGGVWFMEWLEPTKTGQWLVYSIMYLHSILKWIITEWNIKMSKSSGHIDTTPRFEIVF